MNQEKVKSFLYRILCGFLLGISIIAPGISGAVLAIIMGIYNDIITIVSNPFKKFKNNVIFVLPIGIGALIAIALFVNILNFMFEFYRLTSFLLFIGLIGGSIPAVISEARLKGDFKTHYLFYAILAFIAAFTLGIVKIGDEGLISGIPNSIFYPISGAIAGFTAIIPGMSVSMILMVLGVYQPLMAATKSLDIIIMAPVGVCFVIAMILFSRFVKYIFDKHSSLAYYMVTGFMTGSLFTIIFKEVRLPKGVFDYFIGVAAIIIGVLISTSFTKLGKKFNN